MNEKINLALEKPEDAYNQLHEGIALAKDELDKDGVIQRFEFTFELLWKTLKIFLEYQGIDVRTPRDTFKESFRIELITDNEVFLDMLEDRNKSSYIYNKQVSDEIFERIKMNYIWVIEKVLVSLKEKISNE